VELKSDVVSDSPHWFTTAVSAPVEVGTVVVDEARIAYRAWGSPRDPGVLLVHGSAANARWWDHIAPQLAHGRHVVAFDFSGHGDSEWRPSYAQAVWARELRAVVRQVMQPKPVVVAHSMGGKVAYRAALEGMDGDVAAIVFLDANFVHQLRPETAARVRARAKRGRRIYPDVGSVVEAFRPVGVRSAALPRFFAEHVGVHSAQRVTGGWSWKFDPAVAAASADTLPELSRLACPARLLRAEAGSTVDDSAVAQLSAQLGRSITIDVVPGSGHHMMFDAPLELVSTLQNMLVHR
jgi:pimeloyl-ACP methyl ester carboxylesterase